MNRFFIFLVFAFLLLQACAHRNMPPHSGGIYGSPVVKQAQKKENLALKFFRQGGFEKSAELFHEASELYHEEGLLPQYKRALVAEAKALLWTGRKAEFMKKVDALKALIDDEYPDEDTLTLINIAEAMRGKRIPYPPLSGQEDMFYNP